MPEFALYNPIGLVACIVFWMIMLPLFWFTWIILLISLIIGILNYSFYTVVFPSIFVLFIYIFYLYDGGVKNDLTSINIAYFILQMIIGSFCIAIPAAAYNFTSWFAGKKIGNLLRRKRGFR